MGWLALPRRWTWLAAMVGSVGVPALALVAPGALPDPDLLTRSEYAVAAIPGGADWGLVSQPFSAVRMAADDSPTLAAPSISVILLGSWAAVSAIMLAGIALAYARVRAVRHAAHPTRLDGVEIRVAESAGPAVLGLLRPAIVLPAWVLGLPPEERALIVAHEREHLAAGDAWLLLGAALMLAAMPWCVVLWWQNRRLRRAIETDCDARVLAGGADRRDYGRVLIRVAGRTPRFPMLHPAWGEPASQLEWRIITMTEKRPRHALLRSVPLVTLAALGAGAACDVATESEPISAVSTAPEQEEPQKKVILRIDAQGGYRLEDNSAGEEPIPAAELEQVLRDAYAARSGDHLLYLSVDQGVRFPSVLTAIDAARKAGILGVGGITGNVVRLEQIQTLQQRYQTTKQLAQVAQERYDVERQRWEAGTAERVDGWRAARAVMKQREDQRTIEFYILLMIRCVSRGDPCPSVPPEMLSGGPIVYTY